MNFCKKLQKKAAPRFELGDKSFAGFCLTTWPCRQKNKISGRRDSNPRHSAWKADALPTELLPHFRSYRLRYILHEKFLFRNIYFYIILYIFILKISKPNKKVSKNQIYRHVFLRYFLKFQLLKSLKRIGHKL